VERTLEALSTAGKYRRFTVKQLIGNAESVKKTGNRPKKCFTEREMGIYMIWAYM